MKTQDDISAITRCRLALCEQSLARLEQSDAINTTIGRAQASSMRCVVADLRTALAADPPTFHQDADARMSREEAVRTGV